MMDTATYLIRLTMDGLWGALTTLYWPAVMALCIGVLAKGRQLIPDMRAALQETGINLQLIAINLFLVAPVIGALAAAMTAAAAHNGFYLFPPEMWAALPAPLVLLAALIISDFIAYWRHRLEHQWWFWPVHAVHHSDTRMTWLTFDRHHPLHRFLALAVDIGLLIPLGLPLYAIVANSVIRRLYGHFIHCDAPWTFGRWGRIFVSPAMHRWHHAADDRYFDTNYATIFALFDRMFGTYKVPGACETPTGATDRIKPTLAGMLSYAVSPRAYRGAAAARQSIAVARDSADALAPASKFAPAPAPASKSKSKSAPASASTSPSTPASSSTSSSTSAWGLNSAARRLRTATAKLPFAMRGQRHEKLGNAA